MTTSSTSTSSSKDSLIRQQQPTTQQPLNQNGFSKQSFDGNNSKSQSDISEDLDDMQNHTDHRNKLTHIKKTRQFNKRPPSFRTKGNLSSPKDNSTMLTEDSGLFSDKQQVLKSSPTKELSKSINNTDEERLETLNGTFADELAVLKGELDTVRKSSAQTQNEYKNVQNELNDLKKTHDDQMKKMQKKLHDLITEIDEEKKTRLALQVELERLKKTILSN